jgi:hypothetical protein
VISSEVTGAMMQLTARLEIGHVTATNLGDDAEMQTQM